MTLRPRGTTEDGLIAPPELRTGRAPRVATRLCLATFLLATFGTGLVDALWPRPLPELIGAERTADERMRRRANLWDGSLTRLLEHDLRLRSRVRATLGGYYTLALYRWLAETDPRVLAGDDTWLFLTARAVPPPQSDEEIGRAAAAVLAATGRRLASLGVRLVVVPIPRKAVVHAEHLPPGVDPRPGIETALSRALRRDGVETVDVAAAFARAGDAPLYYRADGHWTDIAQAVTAEEIARTAGILSDPATRRTTLAEAGPMPEHRNTLRFLGLGPDHPAADTIELPEGRAWEVFDASGAVVEHANPPEMTRWALTGTSFSAQRKLPVFLSHYAQETVWNGAFDGALLLDNVRVFLREHAEALPELLVLELPVHHVFLNRDRSGAVRWPVDGGELFAAHPPPAVSLLVPDGELPHAGAERDPRRGELTALTGGRFAHSGDGVVALRLRGRVQGAGVQLDLNHGGGRERFSWRTGQTELVVPLLAPQPVAGPLALIAPGDGARRLELSGVDLVTELDLGRASQGRVEGLVQDAQGWHQSIAFPQARVPSHGGLFLELDAVRGWGPALEVEVRAEGREPLHFHIEGANARCTVALGAAGLSGAESPTVEVRGSGRAPERAVRSAILAPPFGG